MPTAPYEDPQLVIWRVLELLTNRRLPIPSGLGHRLGSTVRHPFSAYCCRRSARSCGVFALSYACPLPQARALEIVGVELDDLCAVVSYPSWRICPRSPAYALHQLSFSPALSFHHDCGILSDELRNPADLWLPDPSCRPRRCRRLYSAGALISFSLLRRGGRLLLRCAPRAAPRLAAGA